MSFLNPSKSLVVSAGPTPIVPQFLPAFSTLEGSGPTAANRLYWASQSTAQELADRFGAVVVSKPAFFEYTWARLTFEPATQFYLEFPNGKFYNAGELAGYFQRNPEDKFPGLAEKMARQILVGAGALNA